jgi:hypothetical protein
VTQLHLRDDKLSSRQAYGVTAFHIYSKYTIKTYVKEAEQYSSNEYKFTSSIKFCSFNLIQSNQGSPNEFCLLNFEYLAHLRHTNEIMDSIFRTEPDDPEKCSVVSPRLFRQMLG